MSFDLPPQVRSALNHWLEKHASGSLRSKFSRLTENYGRGETSSSIDLAAYLTTRLPATYAAVSAVFEQVQMILGDDAPSTMLDVGAGPGTASLAAIKAWPKLNAFHLVERDQRFINLSKELSIGTLPQPTFSQGLLQNLDATADLVTAAYVLAELPESAAPQSALALWQATRKYLVIVEPGTPQGYARILAARTALLDAGAFLIGPCTHDEPCPMRGGDWCHFKARLARSREHMHAKSATVPFEDEAYSWIAVSRIPQILPDARIVAPPKAGKIGIQLALCGHGRLADRAIASRDKTAYKRAKKLKWGDSWTPTKA